MSDGDKKTGLKDISDLKARLGMLNKGGGGPKPAAPPGGNPFAPKPAEGGGKVDLSENPDAMMGGDTAVVRISPRDEGEGEAAEQAAPAAKSSFSLSGPPKPAQAPAPPAGGFALGSADELFKKKEPTPAPAPAPAPAAQAGASAPSGGGPAVDPFGPSEPAEPQPGAEFAHPLHQGQYSVAAEPVDLTADEEAALQSFEGSQRGVKTGMAVSLIIVMCALGLVFGFFVGDVRNARRMVNAQIDASIKVKKQVEPLLNQVQVIEGAIAALIRDAQTDTIDFDKVAMLPEELPKVDAGAILSTGIPLAPELARMSMRAVLDIAALFQAVEEHRRLTLGRDKAELQAIADKRGWATYDNFAVTYAAPPPDAPISAYPVKGRVVAALGKPQKTEVEVEVQKGRKTVKEMQIDFEVPVRTREQEDGKKVSIRNLVILRKDDLITSGGTTARDLYDKRMEEIARKLKSFKSYEPALRETLSTEAGREKVFSF